MVAGDVFPPGTMLLARVDPIVLWTWCANAVALLFAFAFGSCIGSLTNVLVYRLPRGVGVVTPPSACPSCATQLTWRENIPVFGWLLLRGRCRFCSVHISAEYPLVEAFVGALFAAMYAMWYILPHAGTGGSFLGVHWDSIAPLYAGMGFAGSWPAFVLLLVLISSLVAMTLVDAKTFTIPLVLAWVPTGAALIAHPLFAVWYGSSHAPGTRPAPPWEWIIAGPDRTGWWWIGASIGGVVGVGVANLLLCFGLIRRSFADYEAWEAAELAKRAAESPATAIGASAPEANDPQHPPIDLWVQYPHARREALKEIAFLAPIAVLGYLGGRLAERWAGPWAPSVTDPFVLAPATVAPIWLTALAAVLMGYLLGGGIVWAVRILGALAFGKDAMGLGDVHLLAAVGACLGWIDAVIAFFLAAFVGLFWSVVAAISGGRVRRVLPFGPYLAIGTVLAMLFKPALSALVTAITHAPSPIWWP